VGTLIHLGAHAIYKTILIDLPSDYFSNRQTAVTDLTNYAAVSVRLIVVLASPYYIYNTKKRGII